MLKAVWLKNLKSLICYYVSTYTGIDVARNMRRKLGSLEQDVVNTVQFERHIVQLQEIFGLVVYLLVIVEVVWIAAKFWHSYECAWCDYKALHLKLFIAFVCSLKSLWEVFTLLLYWQTHLQFVQVHLSSSHVTVFHISLAGLLNSIVRLRLITRHVSCNSVV